MANGEAEQFLRLRKRIQAWTGFRMGPEKDTLIRRRLKPLLEARRIFTVEEYLQCLELDAEERNLCVNAITTNVTSFQRESHHFTFLREKLLEWKRQGLAPLSAWSAACSSGEEAYDIAMTLSEGYPRGFLRPPFVVATDLNSEVLSRAERGVYCLEDLDVLDDSTRKRWFLKGNGQHLGWARVKPELRQCVTFQTLNLIKPWNLGGQFPVIFCRNVLIYFTPDQQAEVVERLVRQLRPGGLLFLGHSESLQGNHPELRWVGRTCYTRVES